MTDGIKYVFLAGGLFIAASGSGLTAAPLDQLRQLVSQKTWTEARPQQMAARQLHEVTAEIWTAAFQHQIDTVGRLEIPARDKPYYLDGPLVLPSGTTLIADRSAEIRLVPGTNTCMVRNANLIGFHDRPVPADCQPDQDITIEGGIWTTTLAATPKAPQGNVRGSSGQTNAVPGTHGVILLHNVRGVQTGISPFVQAGRSACISGTSTTSLSTASGSTTTSATACMCRGRQRVGSFATCTGSRGTIRLP